MILIYTVDTPTGSIDTIHARCRRVAEAKGYTVTPEAPLPIWTPEYEYWRRVCPACGRDFARQGVAPTTASD